MQLRPLWTSTGQSCPRLAPAHELPVLGHFCYAYIDCLLSKRQPEHERRVAWVGQSPCLGPVLPTSAEVFSSSAGLGIRSYRQSSSDILYSMFIAANPARARRTNLSTKAACFPWPGASQCWAFSFRTCGGEGRAWRDQAELRSMARASLQSPALCRALISWRSLGACSHGWPKAPYDIVFTDFRDYGRG
jgi:hypothetical protein